jgi:hypothetical protein
MQFWSLISVWGWRVGGSILLGTQAAWVLCDLSSLMGSRCYAFGVYLFFSLIKGEFLLVFCILGRSSLEEIYFLVVIYGGIIYI